MKQSSYMSDKITFQHFHDVVREQWEHTRLGKNNSVHGAGEGVTVYSPHPLCSEGLNHNINQGPSIFLWMIRNNLRVEPHRGIQRGLLEKKKKCLDVKKLLGITEVHFAVWATDWHAVGLKR